MKRRLSILLVLLLLSAVMIVPVHADGDKLSIDATAQLGPLVTDTYANGYTPAAYKEGSVWKVNIVLPLKTAPFYPLENIIIKPQITDAFPCVPSNIMYVRATADGGLPWMAPFAFTLKDTTADGVYPLTFECTYQYRDAENMPVSESQSFTIYFSVSGKKAPSSDATPAPQLPSTMPRLMLTGYTVTPENVMAGGEMTLEVTIANMSSKQAAQNIKLTLTSADATFLPKDGTNTAYISKLSAGKETTKTFTFNVKTDAAAAPSAISVEIVYNDSSGNAGTETASISIPVNQPIRLKIDEPQVYGSGVSQPFSISMNIYNMGKSTLYNVYAELIGDNLTPDGSFYGGNVESGGTKTIEITGSAVYTGGSSGGEVPEGETPEGEEPMPIDILPAEDGAAKGRAVPSKAEGEFMDMGIIAKPVPIDGGYSGGGTLEYPAVVRITYEDAMGQSYTEEKNIVITLQDDTIVDPGIDEPVEPIPEAGPDLTWLYITLGVLAVAGAVVFLVVRSRKKKRVIEDELL